MDKYHDLDKAVSREILKPLKGEVIPEICNICHGNGLVSAFDGERYVGVECDNCSGTGALTSSISIGPTATQKGKS